MSALYNIYDILLSINVPLISKSVEQTTYVGLATMCRCSHRTISGEAMGRFYNSHGILK